MAWAWAAVHRRWRRAAVIVVVATVIMLQQVGNGHAQHATGYTTDDRALGAANLIADDRATGCTDHGANDVVGHGGGAAEAQGKYQGGKNAHFNNSLKRGAILRTH